MKGIVVLALSGSGVLGGGETLSMRMVRWLHRNDYRTAVMYNETANIIPSLLDFFEEQGVEKILLPDLDGRADMPDFIKARADFPIGSHITIICIQSSFNFFAAQMLHHSLPNCRVDVVHYIIHENDYCRNLSQRATNALIRSLFQGHYRRLVERMEKNGNIAYMTEAYRDHVHQILGIEDTSLAAPIIRLGMDVLEYDEQKNVHRFRQAAFTIMATARFDFPTKGFLLGLVDEFERVFAEYPTVKLIIIGDGPGRAELEAKVAASPAVDNIQLIGAVSYEQLPKYMERANLYVSNGTGPLDAANTGLVSIAANFNTSECLTTGYWCDDITNLGYKGTIPAHELILRTVRMTEAEYLSLAKRTYDAFRNTYGMDMVMQQLLDIKNQSDKPLLSHFYLWFIRLIRKMMNFLIKLH